MISRNNIEDAEASGAIPQEFVDDVLLSMPEDELFEALDIDLNDPSSAIEEHEDGSVTVDLSGESAVVFMDEDIPHDYNLADLMTESDLTALSREVLDFFTEDSESRKEWLERYMEGVRLLGLSEEQRTDPWEGACSIVYSGLTEAVIRYQSQAISSVFPASGPVKTQIVGADTPEKQEAAARVAAEMNYQLTEKMPEYRDELEQTLLMVPVAGAAFKKVYPDPIKKRARSMFVPAENLIISYGATCIEDAERISHLQYMSKHHVRQLVVAGFWRDVLTEFGDSQPELLESKEQEDEIFGVQQNMHDDRHTIIEMHGYFDLDVPGRDPNGLALPYIVTIDKSSEKILAVRRNWDEADPLREREEHFVRYTYLPGKQTPYGMGLIHLIGSITKAVTSIQRQLIDAGTLANLPGGFKSRGLRWKGDDRPHAPGEWRDVDVAGGKIADSLMPLPYKEPSQTLHTLMKGLMDDAQRLGSILQFDDAAMSSETPVGTIMAILEQKLLIHSAIHSRLHAAMRKELRLIAKVIAKYMPDQYDYDTEVPASRVADFSNRASILPVSDPNASTLGMRMVQHQIVMQQAATNPDLYNMEELHAQGLKNINYPNIDKVMKMTSVQRANPVSENMGVLTGKPIQAFPDQDHEAHLAVHMNFVNDPKMRELVGQSPNAGNIMAVMEAHIAEHLAFEYRRQMEVMLGTSLPAEDQELPPDIENNLSRLIKVASDKLLQRNETEIAAQQAEMAANDPVIQQQNRELDLEEQKIRQKYEIDMAKLQTQREIANDRLKSEELRAGTKMAAEMLSSQQKHGLEETKAGLELGIQISDRLEGHRQ